MPVPPATEADQLLHNLRLLCAQPSNSQDVHHLEPSARLVADMMRHTGLDARVVRAGGAPVVIGWRSGRRPFTLLLYHHYDVTPTGPWREWLHEPFQIAEREGYIYGRGVAHGKGPLAAHLHALHTMLQADGELPHGIVVIAEGERLAGSIHLEQVIKHYSDQLHVHACLGTGGERDANGIPFCYTGSKGLLQVRLTARGSTVALAPTLAASVSNPAWRLVWALSSIKGADEDIRINGFYDAVEGPNRNQRTTLRKVQLDEDGRLNAWQIPEFLFSMSGSTLVRTEVTLPTCNLSSYVVEPSKGVASIPTSASARLDFHLVPNQQPDMIFNLLRKHLIERGLKDIVVERLPGSYAPIQGDAEQQFVQQLIAAGQTTYQAPLTILPAGLFTQPLNIFAHYLKAQVAVLAFGRHDSSEYGPNEHIPLDDLVKHSNFLVELMTSQHEYAREVALPG